MSALKYGSVRWGLPAPDRSSSPLDADLADDMSWTDEIQGTLTINGVVYFREKKMGEWGKSSTGGSKLLVFSKSKAQ